MKIKKLMPMDAESRRLIDWMEKGVYDALQKKYLKTLLFCICEELGGPMIEEYAFSFSYSSSDSEEVSMNVNRSGNKKHGATFKSNTAEITPNQMRSSACKMVRTLVQLMRTLDRMPDERTILMKLLYHDDVTPMDYEPPFFRSCAEQEANNPWSRNPLKMEVGNVNSKHFVLALKVKSVLDPCEDENDDLQEDEEVSLGADSLQHRSNDSSTDSELEEEQYILAPAGREIKQRTNEDNDTVPEDDTQDAEEEGGKLARVRDWIASRHMTVVDLADVLSSFPDISMVLTEEIMEKLSEEGLLTKTGRDSYNINKPKKVDSDLRPVKEEFDIPEHPINGKRQESAEEDNMYMKALYYALPMDYVSIAKLQNKLDGVANQNTVRKLLDKMAHDGYIEGKSNRRLGKRVIHSELTNRKLLEIKKALANEASGLENNRPSNKSSADHIPVSASNVKDISTCGGLHSIGSDMTRTHGKSGNSARSEHTSWAKPQEQVHTPVNMAGPTVSRESTIPGNGEGGVNAKSTHCEALEASQSTQEKKSRKASTVKEPIIQYVKRQKSQPA